MGGLDGLPKPPAFAHAPAEPGRGSISRDVPGGLDKPPKPRALAHTRRKRVY